MSQIFGIIKTFCRTSHAAHKKEKSEYGVGVLSSTTLKKRRSEMASRYVKPVFAILAAVALSLAFAARTSAAPAAGLNWEIHGIGSGSMSVLTGGTSSGPAMSQHIGNGTYSLTLSSPVTFGNNGAGGVCALVTGSGGIQAADGSTIAWATVGMLCNEAGAFSSVQYNGTYRITGGSGRFVGVAGGGSLTATFDSPHFIKIDGTITGL